jgi:hypothetical protein
MAKKLKRRLGWIAGGILLSAVLVIWGLKSLCVTKMVDLNSGDFKEQQSIFNMMFSNRAEPSMFSALAEKAGLDRKTTPGANWKVDTIKYPFSGLHETTQYFGARTDLNSLARVWELCATPDSRRLEQAKLVLSLLQMGRRFRVGIDGTTVTVMER